MAVITTEKTEEKDKKYSKILNNLLDIKGREQAIYTKINGTDSFDLNTKFGKIVTQRVLKQKDFALTLDEKDIVSLIEEIKDEDDYEKIIEAYEVRKERLYNTKKLQLENPITFEQTKTEILEKLEEKVQKRKNRWNSLIRKVIDENIRENIWPLHVATFYISVKTHQREVFAPLLLKEVNLSFVGNSLKMKSQSDWKINEKLLFIINQANFGFSEEINLNNELTGLEAIEQVSCEYEINTENNSFSGEFNNVNKKEIKNTIIKVHDGVTLGMFKPSGGSLRKTMLKIIENDEVDEIIQPEIDKKVYEENINSEIVQRDAPLLRIQKSNFSQDKATISSLIQDTIIWGPPGTGKSQTIANIITNVLHDEKTAVVMSQKKAALDVLKKRLGKLSKYALFILNDNKMIKSEFYKPLQSFVHSIENSLYVKNINETNIISEQEIENLKSIRKTKDEGTYEPTIDLISMVSGQTESTNIEYLSNLYFNLDEKLKYPEIKEGFSLKIYIEKLAKINKIEKKGFIFKRYPKRLKYLARKIEDVWKEDIRGDINTIIELTKLSNVNAFNSLIKCSTFEKQKTVFKSNEEYVDYILSKKRLDLVKEWQANDREMFKDYKRFANAVRAGRSLPYKFINNFVNIIQKLFPVIITTPQTNFVNWEKESFDYAIIDESSQMFLEIGLPIVYLAKTHILAGDPEQMKPSRWFATRDDSESEEEIPENAESLLDYGLEKGMYGIMLDKNYRSSYAALMSFSAKEFYNSELDVVDIANSDDENPVKVINVKGEWYKGINEIEAQKVISIAQENLDLYESIIILTFNAKQKQYITTLIIEKYPDLFNAINDDVISLRNIENIQGDEADLVIASVVYDHTTNMGSTYVARSGGKNALNVAISRAKEKMIVVKSVNGDNIKSAKSEDFNTFKRWLEFLDFSKEEKTNYSHSDETQTIDIDQSDGDSGFEDDVADYIGENILTSKKLRLVKQYEVGSRRIDLAFVDDKTKKYVLGIEVDGYRYHEGQGFDKYLQDMARQEYLESKGYNIYRIKEIKWSINKDKIMMEIKELLKLK